MKRAFLFTVLVSFAFSNVGCTPAPPESDAPAAASSDGEFWSHRFSVTEDVSYGDDPAQKLDLYTQGSWVGEPTYFEGASDPRPMLIFIHGGGWVQGDKTGWDMFFLPFLERGWHVANITYRLGPGTAPAAVDDAVCALDWVVERAEQMGVDSDKIVVGGFSAGGHLALTTGILASRPGHECYPGDEFRVHSVINWFGITEIEAVESFLAENLPGFNYAADWIADPEKVAEISAAYSPIYMVDENAPAILTIHGTDDGVVPHTQAVSFHERLDELGIRHQLLSLEGGKHVGFSDAQFQEAFRTMLAFVEGA